MSGDEPTKPDLTVVRGGLVDPPKAKPDDADDTPRARRTGEIYPGCPVQALGVDDDAFVYLSVLMHVRILRQHSAAEISGVFGGRADLLSDNFPTYRGETITGWNQRKAMAAMQQACSEVGIIDSTKLLRETGAWKSDTGGLIWHCGQRVLIRNEQGRDEYVQPGRIGDHIYPANPPAPQPANCTDAEAREGVAELLTELQSWNWKRGDIDARLMLGWVGCGMVGGALGWRPMGWVTGDASTGKSTLQELVEAVMGGETGMLVATDTTEAGIRSLLMRTTRPVWIDEAEPEVDDRKLQAVVKLARQASSGAMILRGAADHSGAEFRVRSCMMFSSILVPALKDQDLSRIAILKLDRLDPGARRGRLVPAHWAGIGARIRRLIWKGWDEFADTLDHYREQLMAVGHNARGADQYGHLLAMADLLLVGGEPSSDDTSEIVSELSAESVSGETGQSSDWRRCLTHLFSQPLDVHRSGTRFTVGEWIMGAASLDHAPEACRPAKEANVHLKRHGMQVVGDGRHAQLEIMNDHEALRVLFRDTHWGGGVHSQAIERVEGWSKPKQAVRTWSGVRSRVSAFPLSSWFSEDEDGAS